MAAKMTNKIILLLSIFLSSLFLSSCQFKTVDFRKEGNFDVYVRLDVVEGVKRPTLFIPLIKGDSASYDFCFGEKNTLYRLSVLREDGKLLTETTLIPNEVKGIVLLSPNLIRKEYRREKK